MRKYTQLDEIVAKIEKVTAGDVAEICKRNFSEECMSLTILGPTKDIALPNRLLL